MRRIGFGVVLTLNLVLAPLAAEAQQPSGKVPRIGILWPYSPTVTSPLAEAFRQGLRGQGYIEGQNITVEERWAEGKYDRFPVLAAELVSLKIDVLVAAGTPAISAAKQTTTTVPIVMAFSNDPVESGFVASLARPGANITGLSLVSPELSGRRLELLKAVSPKISRLAVLRNPSNSSHAPLLHETETAARVLKVQLQPVEAQGPAEFESAFVAMTRARAGALVVLPDAVFRDHQKQLVGLAAKSRLPTMYWTKELVDAGGLMAYGANIPDMLRRAAVIVDKILKGAKPADLPVEQPTKFELVINLKTAKALGLTIPPSVLGRADQVIACPEKGRCD
jgi:putative ABC transport system substrate-binding protein